MNKFFSCLLLAFIAISSAFLFVIAVILWLLTVWWDKRLVWLSYLSTFWGSLYVWVTPYWRPKYYGRENIDRSRTYVIVSNHQSMVDILVAYGLFMHFKWVSKAEVFKLPFIGWNMKLNRYVALKRGRKSSIKDMMRDCEEHLRNGSSIFLFPEGTRSEDGQLKPFRNGAFELAKKAGVPILPVAISGATNALPKHSLELNGRHDISVTILPAIEPESYQDKSVREIAKEVHGIIQDKLEQN